MQSSEIRRRFVDFFASRGHRYVESAPLVPLGDPTLLFTSAGMVPFKPYFLGQVQPPAPRLTSVQRCFRTTDIDSVGDDSHHTFFEMLGNFSFGDYFKAEAIAWAWQFITKELGLPADRLWITVYHDDEEAIRHWQAQGVPDARILRYGVEEGNYWYSGEVGPCGPCSEIHYDYGKQFGCGPDCEVRHDHGRWLEVWNLVFMTSFRDADGRQTPLPKANIDTGAGLERLTAVVNGQRSAYETDAFDWLIRAAEPILGVSHGRDAGALRALRVVADHLRAAAFLIADGVMPSNEGRGYVLRRLFRRMVFFARGAGTHEPFAGALSGLVVDTLAPLHPFLAGQRAVITTTLDAEERRFLETLERGSELLESLLDELPEHGTLSGEDLFRLYDTHGVPPELAREIADSRGHTVDLAGFEAAMERAREAARAGAQFRLREVAAADALAALQGEPTEFLGHDALSVDAHVRAIVHGERLVERLREGQEGQVVLDRTPFYPEGGGQVGDTGVLRGDACLARVLDTQRSGAAILHRVRADGGPLHVGDTVRADVDALRRAATRRNHTGTHLAHAALRQVLGAQVRQAGSLVAPDRLRFDFTLAGAPDRAALVEVQRLVNRKVREDVHVETRTMPYDEAVRGGALAFFGEKYGAEVRVVSIDRSGERPFSVELCGGTHTRDTGEIGLFVLASEGGIGSGVRRIEALTGEAAERLVEERFSTLEQAAQGLGVQPDDLLRRIDQLHEETDELRRRLQRLEQDASHDLAGRLAGQAERVDGLAVLVADTPLQDAAALRKLGDQLRGRLGASALVLAGRAADGKPIFVAMFSPEVITRGLKAGAVARAAAQVVGGGGGGRDELAQAGGNDASRLPEALDTARRLLRERLQGAS